MKSTAVFCGVVEVAFTSLGVVTLILEAMNVAFTLDADGFSADVAKMNNAKYAPTFDECIPYNTIRIFRLMCSYFIYTWVSKYKIKHSKQKQRLSNSMTVLSLCVFEFFIHHIYIYVYTQANMETHHIKPRSSVLFVWCFKYAKTIHSAGGIAIQSRFDADDRGPSQNATVWPLPPGVL